MTSRLIERADVSLSLIPPYQKMKSLDVFNHLHCWLRLVFFAGRWAIKKYKILVPSTQFPLFTYNVIWPILVASPVAPGALQYLTSCLLCQARRGFCFNSNRNQIHELLKASLATLRKQNASGFLIPQQSQQISFSWLNWQHDLGLSSRFICTISRNNVCFFY